MNHKVCRTCLVAALLFLGTTTAPALGGIDSDFIFRTGDREVIPAVNASCTVQGRVLGLFCVENYHGSEARKHTLLEVSITRTSVSVDRVETSGQVTTIFTAHRTNPR